MTTPQSESRSYEPQRYLPFGVCLLLLFVMGWDGLSGAFYGIAGIITLIPAALLTFMAWGLLVSRADSVGACVLSVYLMALGLLARDNFVGLHILAQNVTPNVPYGSPAFEPSPLLWALALGVVPLIYVRQFAAPSDSKFAPFRTLTLLFGMLTFLLLHALTVYFASRFAPSYPLMAPLLLPPTTAHHQLLVYSAPLLLLSHFVVIRRLSQKIQVNGDRQASASLWIFFAGGLYLLLSCLSLLAQSWWIGIMSLLMAYVIPVVSVYALEHYALFGIHLTLRRVVQYSLARSTLTVMTVAPLIFVAFLLGSGFEWKRIEPTIANFLVPRAVSTLSALISLLLTILSGTLLIFRLPLLNWLDRTYFREVYDAQRVLNQMTRRLIRPTSLTDLGEIALQGIVTALHPKSGLIVMLDKGSLTVLAAHNLRSLEKLADESLLSGELPIAYPPDQFEAEEVIAFQNALSFNAAQLLREGDIRLILPVREENVAAVLLLGAKVNGSEYTPEDLEMLAALSPQIALGLQNTVLTRDQLQSRTQEMTKRSAGFAELVERERRLFAADLHDQTLPDLRCLLTDLQTLQTAPEANAPELPEMEDRLKQAIENIRDMMESLRPSALEMLGLLPALENEVRKSAARARPPLIPQFHADPSLAGVSFPNFTEVLIFRIMQEAVNNVCRHAKARHVRVTIEKADAFWRLRVEDDGTGLPPAETRRVGNGLGNMQFRANLIGAGLQWSVPEHGIGTRVELSVPLLQ